jgi:hypothetical protein
VARFQRIFFDASFGNGFCPSQQRESATACHSCDGGPTDLQYVDTKLNSCLSQVCTESTGSGSISLSGDTASNFSTASATMCSLLGDTDPCALLDTDESEVGGTGKRIKSLGLRCVLARSSKFIKKENEKDWDSEDSVSCYELRLPHFYSKLCILFLMPLFSTETGSFEFVAKLRASLQSKLGRSILDEESHILLAQSLSSPIPPALLLRVALVRLQSAMPPAHPDKAVSSETFDIPILRIVLQHVVGSLLSCYVFTSPTAYLQQWTLN